MPQQQTVQQIVTYLNSGVHDESCNMYRAGLAQAVGPPHSLLQNGGVQRWLQQKHMICCTSQAG